MNIYSKSVINLVHINHAGRLKDIVYPLALLLFFAVFVAWNIRLPGLYMDAVNPDYMVVRYLEPGSTLLPMWYKNAFLPSYYHGNQHIWFGLPIYAVFDTTLKALRSVQAAFGAGILLCLYMMFRRIAVPFVAAFAVVPLACDPSFLMSFRTQGYITLAPTLWLFMSLLLITGKKSLPPWRWILSGWAMGWAIFGYFIYAFFLPVVGLVAWHSAKFLNSNGQLCYYRSLVLWIIGLILGLSFYFIGYGLLIHDAGGLVGFLDMFNKQAADLGVFSSTMGLMDRQAYAFELMRNVLSGTWHEHWVFYWVATLETHTTVTILVLSAGALIGLTTPSTRRFAGLFLVLGVSFVLVGLIFGSRLGGHHYLWVIPFLYAMAGMGLVNLFSRGVVQRWLAVLVVIGIVGNNINNLHLFHAKLERTGGIGLYSDAITNFAEEALVNRRADHYFFPEWGLFMPFSFLTGGKIPYNLKVDDSVLKDALCNDRRVMIALPGADRRIAMLEYAEKLHSVLGETVAYRQRDGKSALELAFLSPEHGSCTSTKVFP